MAIALHGVVSVLTIFPVVMNSSVARSTFVTVVGWLFLVFSGFSSLIGIVQNVMVWVMFRPHRSELGDAPAANASEWMSRHIELWFAAVLLVSVVTFIASVGLLRRKDWARRLFIVVLVFGIAWMIFALVMQLTMLSTGPSTASPGMEGFALMTKVIAITSALISAALMGAFGWIIKRLVSLPIREEFVAAGA